MFQPFAGDRGPDRLKDAGKHLIFNQRMKAEKKAFRRAVMVLLCITLGGCAGTSSFQGVQYSSKNSKSDIYTPLPVITTEEQLVRMLESLTELVGTGYRYGGTGNGAFDCSGFVQHIFRDTFNARIPRTARNQSRFGPETDDGELQRGDLVFFRLGGSRIDHVGIYLDDGLFVHASSSKGVTLASLRHPYYARHFIKAVRLLEIR
ncbi:MAG: C40 family peptidase [Prosthecochloris sp.]|nr:C40 family peptidase [Prosthecochloris sp.]